MRLLTGIARLIGVLARAATVDAAHALIEMVRRWIDHIRQWCKRLKLPHPDRNSGAECVMTDHPAMRRPDPTIYSQSYLMGLGLPVTWDNPDINLFLNGVPVSETDLLPGTQYEIEATIWNNSFNAPVVGMPVEFSFLTFGVATTTTAIGNAKVNVGAKGTANHPAKTRIPWVTPASGGHFCIQVSFVWAEDAIPGNNLGQNNVDVRLAQSPALFEFQLRNARREAHRYSFKVDTYQLLELPECKDEPAPPPVILRSARIDRIVARHRAVDFSVPANWIVGISPANPTLQPNEEITVQVVATPPAGFVGEKAFNVNAFADGTFAGGVTLVARAT